MSAYHSAGNSEAQEKQGLAALLRQSSPGIAATGVLTGLQVTQTPTASASVQIGQGAAVVGSSFTKGASLLTGPDPTLDVLTANPVGGLPRNDIVVFDSATAKVAVIVGSPNASPTDPVVPATAARLARLRHAANATTIPGGNIDDLRFYTGLLAPTPQDTGWVSSGFTPGPGWGIGTYMKARQLDKEIEVRGESVRTGAAIRGADRDAPSPGNVSPDEVLVTVPAWACPTDIDAGGVVDIARCSGTAGPVQLFPSGVVQLTSITTNGLIQNKDTVRWSFKFFAG